MREPDWDWPERITPPDEQRVECRECRQMFDQADGFEWRDNLYCDSCRYWIVTSDEYLERESEDGDDS